MTFTFRRVAYLLDTGGHVVGPVPAAVSLDDSIVVPFAETAEAAVHEFIADLNAGKNTLAGFQYWEIEKCIDGITGAPLSWQGKFKTTQGCDPAEADKFFPPNASGTTSEA
jgi:hypothetical protein